MLKRYKIEYFDEIEATDKEQAIEFLLSHLSRDVEYSDATCFEITEIGSNINDQTIWSTARLWWKPCKQNI